MPTRASSATRSARRSGVYAHDLEAHRDAVPRAALSARRACVPSTVSLTEIRSHAPARTSSNVRARIRLDVVAAEPEAIACRPVRPGDRRERELVARLLHEARVLGPIVRERPLDEGVRLDLAPEALLEPELRDRDLAGRLGGLELGERPVADAVRLDADPARLELGELVPVERLVPHAEQTQRLLVRQRAARRRGTRSGTKTTAGIAVPPQDRERVLEVVAIAVVEGDQDRAGRKRRPVQVVVAHRVERHRRVAELAEQRHLLREDGGRHGGRVRPEVVDLVVHEHAKRAIGLAVERADAAHRLADRAVDAVLQQLLRPVAHASRECRWLADDLLDEARERARVLLGRREPGLDRDPRRGPEPLCERAVGEHPDECVGERSGVARRDEEPGLAVLDDVRDAADPAATTPRPRQNASTTTRPSPSEREGSTSTVASSSARATSGVGSDSSSASAPAARRRDARRPRAASRGRRGAASRRGRAAQRGATPRRARRPPCSARARRRRAPSGAPGSGVGARSRNGSRSMNAANVARSAPLRLRGRGRRCRRRSSARRPPGAARGARAHRRAARAPSAAASRRAASGAAGSPWMSAITFVGTRASFRAEERERGLLGALGEHRVGPEGAQLARDAERQQRVEAGPSRTRGRVGRTSAKRASDPRCRRPRSRERARPAPPRARRTSARARATAGASSAIRPTMSSFRFTCAAARWSSSSIRAKTASSRVARRPTPARLRRAASRASVVGEEPLDRRCERRRDRRAARAGRSRRRARPRARRRPRSRSPGSRQRAPRRRCAGSSPTPTREREASAARNSRRTPLPRDARRGSATRPSSPSSRARRSSAARSGPSPAIDERRPRAPPRAPRARRPSAFCGPSRPANASIGPSRPSSARSSSRGGSGGTSGAGLGSTETRSGSSPQPSATSRRYALGQKTWRARRSAASRVARRARGSVRRLRPLELLERAVEPAAPRALARRPRPRRASRRAAAARATHRARRAGACSSRRRRPARGAPCERGAPRARAGAREPPGGPVHGVLRAGRARVRRRHHLDAVAALVRGTRRARVRGSPARPDRAARSRRRRATLTARFRRRGASGRRRSRASEAREHDRPGRGEHERRDEHRDRRARRAPLGAEHGDERDRDERLEPVRDDAQPGPPDRDRERLRPADRELDRRGEQDDARGVDGARRTPAPKTTSTSQGIARKNTGTATSISAPAPSVYFADPGEDAHLRARAPSRASAR